MNERADCMIEDSACRPVFLIINKTGYVNGC